MQGTRLPTAKDSRWSSKLATMLSATVALLCLGGGFATQGWAELNGNVSDQGGGGAQQEFAAVFADEDFGGQLVVDEALSLAAAVGPLVHPTAPRAASPRMARAGDVFAASAPAQRSPSGSTASPQPSDNQQKKQKKPNSASEQSLQGLTRSTGLQIQGLASPLATMGEQTSHTSKKSRPAGIDKVAVPTVRVWAPSHTYMRFYRNASQQHCTAVGWPVLAALGQVESGHGANMGPSSAGALGPAQFLPSTWNAMVKAGTAVDGDGDGRYDIGNPADAIPTAAVKLCRDGATSPEGTLRALWRYNPSWSYVALVAQLAHAYSHAYPTLPVAPLPATKNSSGRTLQQAQAHAEVSYVLAPGSENALRQALIYSARRYLGVRYLWGGTNPQVGLDCSGLVQLVYRQHGVSLPRVSADQAQAGQPVASLNQAKPGDLVAFGSPVDHIGIYLGQGMMLHAPRTGTVVEIAPVRSTPTAIRRVVTAQTAAAMAVPMVTGMVASDVGALAGQVVGVAPSIPLASSDASSSPRRKPPLVSIFPVR